MVLERLEPLRAKGWLTHFNGTDVIQGPITVVGTGNTPFDLVTANDTYRDIFYDAPLDRLADENDDTMPGETPSPNYNRHNSDYASVSFKKVFWPFVLEGTHEDDDGGADSDCEGSCLGCRE